VSESAKTMIEVTDLHKSFGSNEVLKGISTTINQGEVVAVIGPSGSGKSTFLRCLNLLEEVTSGKVIVEGRDLTDKNTDINQVRQKIGMVFQHFNLFPHQTVAENIMLAPSMLKKLSKTEARSRAESLLAQVKLSEKIDARPAQLSGGQKQRVAIGRALMNSPELVMFDEPTSALDSKLGDQVVHLIRDEMKQRGTSAIIVTHDERITHYADRTVHITDGQITDHDHQFAPAAAAL